MTPKRFSDATAAIALLAEIFPNAFFVYEARRRPLKIGIHNDIIARLDGALTAPEISLALSIYTGNRGYLRAMRTGAVRFDLDGNSAGTVTHQEARHAADRLKKQQRQLPKPSPEKPRLTLIALREAGARRKRAVP